MRFLHCSDVHITQNYFDVPWQRLGWRRCIALLELRLGGRAIRYRDARGTLARIAGDTDRHQVDHLIVSGDLTAYSTDREFQGAREALGEIAKDPRRCTIIPGNHDVYTRNALKSRRFEKYFGHLLRSDLPEYAREDSFPFVRLLGEDAAVVGLNSARLAPVPGLSFGLVGHRQLSALRDIVHDPRVAKRAVLVVVHHAPLARSGRPDRLTHGLLDGQRLFEILRGPRFAVLHGHIHQRYHHGATDHRPHTFGAGSSTELGHEGYWIIDVRDGIIERGVMHSPLDLAPAAA